MEYVYYCAVDKTIRKVCYSLLYLFSPRLVELIRCMRVQETEAHKRKERVCKNMIEIFNMRKSFGHKMSSDKEFTVFYLPDVVSKIIRIQENNWWYQQL